MQNPLLNSAPKSESTYIPFPQFKDSDYKPAFEGALASAKANLEKLASDSTTPTFVNTVEALEFFREELDHVSLTFFNLKIANQNDAIQAYAKEIAPILADFSNDLILNAKIFARVKKVFDQGPALKLTREQQMLLEKTYKAFARNGALLKETQKDQLRKIDQRLALITQEYSDHVLKITNDYFLLVSDAKDIADLPAHAIAAAAQTAEAKGHKGAWAFTLQAPSLMPFLQYCGNEKLRHELWFASASRATKGKEDNRPHVKEIATLRFERAKLLGYATHAHYVLEERMAEKPEQVNAFIQKISQAAKAAGVRDVEDLRQLKQKATGENTLNPWDVAFYSEKLRLERYEYSEEETRPYFPIEKVIFGVFEHARLLYGIVFKHREDIPVYHPDVKAYEVCDETTGKHIGIFFADFFPRESKQGGAWMTEFRPQGIHFGKKMRPQVSIVCNFTKPSPGHPSLLTIGEVETFFHEFGHALHGMLSDVNYPSLAGPSVYWDFVELPSQMMENWVMEKEALNLFAAHYQTGAKIPDALVEKIIKAARFQAGYSTMRQLAFATLDMAWHGVDPSKVSDVEQYETEAMKDASLFPHQTGACASASFSHIFAGGYSAGYYSYKWAEVLDADAFEFFKEKGIFSREVAQKFRENILSKGGTEPPMELYKRFRGREPDTNALLRRDGLI